MRKGTGKRDGEVGGKGTGKRSRSGPELQARLSAPSSTGAAPGSRDPPPPPHEGIFAVSIARAAPPRPAEPLGSPPAPISPPDPPLLTRRSAPRAAAAQPRAPLPLRNAPPALLPLKGAAPRAALLPLKGAALRTPLLVGRDGTPGGRSPTCS